MTEFTLMDKIKEDWRPIAGWEGKYEVSDLGRVRSLDRKQKITQRNRVGKVHAFIRSVKGVPLRPGLASNGYLTVAIGRQSHTVHSLVANAFLGPYPPGKEVRHKNGTRKDNRLANLEYGTPSENNHDMDTHGTRTRGSRYSNAKLNEKAAVEIMSLKGVVSQSKLADRYGVSPAAIQAVHDGRTWTHA